MLALVLLAANAWAQDVIHGRAIGISDGDTIKVCTAEHQLLRIRLSWIDAPEMGQAFGNNAKQAMSALVFGKDVELRPHAIDRYGRLVAMVFVDGRDTGLELIRQGLAWAYEYYLTREGTAELQQSYTMAETAARVSRIGLWQDNDPVPPWEWRKAEREQRAALQR
jgi:endonuclease YncB( thermonuclease family)